MFWWIETCDSLTFFVPVTVALTWPHLLVILADIFRQQIKVK